jgi:tRNA(Arg) A34 adenosine deaminase TadA
MTAAAPATATQRAAARPGSDEAFMRAALEAARRAGLAGEPPIGACLVRGDAILATASNCVISTLDVTAHAEIAVIREACRRERALDLAGCTLFVTVEPCPMCYAASHYARIGRIVCGARLDDLQALTGNELAAPGTRPSGLPLVADVLREESLALLRAWAGGRRR